MPAVREATPDDEGRIADLHAASIRAFGPDAYDEAQVEAWAGADDPEPDYPIDDGDHHVVVAERGGEVAGFGDLHVPGAEVTAVYVHPDHAREGVGSAILSALEGAARERGIDEVGLLASRNAVPFYEGRGYRRVEARVHETGGEELECVWMRKRVR